MLNIAACEQFTQDSESPYQAKRLPTETPQHRPVTPLALLYPPVIADGVVEKITAVSCNAFKKSDFLKHRTNYSALLVFAKYLGLVDDLPVLDHRTALDAENVPYEQLHEAYTTSIERLGGWMNASMQAISGELPNCRECFTFDTASNNEGDVALYMEGEPFPCLIPLSGGKQLDQMVNSLLRLLSPYSCATLPQDLLDYCCWFEEEGEALMALKKELKSDDLQWIAHEVCDKPEQYSNLLCDFMHEIEDEQSLYENLVHIDERYEEIPSHLIEVLTTTQIINILCQWTATDDARLSDPRTSVIKKGLLVYKKIKQREDDSKQDVYLSSEDFGADEAQSINLSMLISYGLKFEKPLFWEMDEQRMQMGEALCLHMNLAPVANKRLRDTLLNIAQAHGLIELLERSIGDGKIIKPSRRKNALR